MPEPRTTTGPVVLPPNPKAVADHAVADLSSLGNLHRPPTEREYEHAALNVALDAGPDDQLFAVLAHLDAAGLSRLGSACLLLTSGVTAALRDRGAIPPVG